MINDHPDTDLENEGTQERPLKGRVLQQGLVVPAAIVPEEGDEQNEVEGNSDTERQALLTIQNPAGSRNATTGAGVTVLGGARDSDGCVAVGFL